MLLALMRALELVTYRPRVRAVSGGWPSASATTAAQSARTGARLTWTGDAGTSLIATDHGADIGMSSRSRPGNEIGHWPPEQFCEVALLNDLKGARLGR